jgi:uncharacterized protein (DUF2141 family)
MRGIKALMFWIVSVLVMITFTNCQKAETTGDLEVFVEDITGVPIVGQKVYLYNNQADFNNVIFSDSRVTNNSGRVIFSNLNPGVYYVDCDFNNQAGGTTTITGSGSVSAGFVTTITIRP